MQIIPQDQIQDELDLVRIQLQILTYRMRKNIKKCNRVAESIDRSIQKIQFVPSESNDQVMYKSGNSSTCHSYLRKSRISLHSSSSLG
jgi:hypothetical protein